MYIREDVFERMKVDLTKHLEKEGVDQITLDFKNQSVYISYNKDEDKLEVQILGKKEK